MDLLPSYYHTIVFRYCYIPFLYCIIPKWSSLVIYISFSFPPTQFPKNNNNSRMPSVNIIEVWLPGPFLSLQDFMFSRTSRPAFRPICLSGWGRGSGPLGGAFSPPALGHGSEMGPQDSGRRGPVTAQPVWEQSLQQGDCGKGPAATAWYMICSCRIVKQWRTVLRRGRPEDKATPGTEDGEQSQRAFFIPRDHWQQTCTCSLPGLHGVASTWSKPTYCFPHVLFSSLLNTGNHLIVSL